MAEDVVINVKQETQGNALAETAEKIRQLRAEAESLRRASESYAKSGDGFDDPRARSARAEAASREREANRLERPLKQEDKAAQKSERDARAQALRDERAAQKEAAREAGEEKRKYTQEDKAAQKAERDARAQTLREERDAKRAIAAEQRKAEKDAAEEERRREAVMAARMRIAGAVGGAAVALGGTLGQDYFSRQQIALQDQAARANFARNRELHATRGFSAGEAIGEVRSLEDSIFEREQKKPQLENDRKSNILKGALAGGASGAATGAFIGGPVGAAIGGLAGLGIGAFTGKLAGDRAKSENDAGQIREKEELEKAKAEQQKRFAQEITPQLEARRAGLNYDMQSKRFAEDKVAAVKEYNAILKAGGDAELAKEAAIDSVREKQRERAGNVAGLVNARTGTRGTAQLARIAAGLDDPERAGRVFAAALKPVINEAAQPPLHDWMRTGGRR